MPGIQANRGEGEAPPRKQFRMQHCHCGIPEMLGQGCLSDLTLRLPDGKTLAVHRVMLAASSKVLRAKFEAPMKDAAEQEWAPEVGSAAAWEWLLGWMYSGNAPLPLGLLVEVLVLADHFQIGALTDAIAGLAVRECAAELVGQLLEVWACPQVLDRIAQECVPEVALDGAILQRLQSAALPNAALFVKFVPLGCEEDRVLLLRALSHGADGHPRGFPDCFLEAVHWDALPAAVLTPDSAGRYQLFEELYGQPIPASDRVQRTFFDALASRCSKLEQQAPKQAADVQRSRIHIPLPQQPAEGLFSWMVAHGLAVEVARSSPGFPRDLEPADLVTLTNMKYISTKDQGPDDQPWIELSSKSLFVRPEGVGLKHGRQDDNWRCQSFVVEAALGSGDWTTLLAHSQEPLGLGAAVFRIPSETSAGKFFNRFRLRMTGENTGGPCSGLDWLLTLGWFEVFGCGARWPVLEQLRQHAASA